MIKTKYMIIIQKYILYLFSKDKGLTQPVKYFNNDFWNTNDSVKRFLDIFFDKPPLNLQTIQAPSLPPLLR